MELYKKYKNSYPNKTDSEIIESIAWELKDKVETIHRLLNENKSLHIDDVTYQIEPLICDCQDFDNGLVSMYCKIHNENPYEPE